MLIPKTHLRRAGRGGSILLTNAPVMLSLVIGAIKRVILRPSYNKGALIEKGFLGQYEQHALCAAKEIACFFHGAGARWFC